MVIVTYEPDAVITAVLDAIDHEDVSAIVVVDNSPRGSVELDQALASHPGITLAVHPENLGFCAGNNLGLRMLPKTDYVLFLNPDAVVPPGFVATAVDVLDRHPTVGALNPKLLRIDPAGLHTTGELDCAGVFPTWYGRHYDRGQGSPDVGQYDGPPERVPALCGAAMFCRREALDAVAPDGEVFDERFFMYKEDVDLSWRLRHEGWELLYVSDLAVGHVRGARSVAADPKTLLRLRRRSLTNDWRVWRKGLLPLPMRMSMFCYLIAKTIRVRLLPWRLP